jgi:6-phosphogluconolactonase
VWTVRTENPTWHIFSDRDELASEVSRFCADMISLAIQEHGEARLALSGGSTPEPIYKSLAQEDVDWARVRLALVDERWVPPEHEASNERLLRECFAKPLAAGARLVPMKTAAATPKQALADVEARYRPLRPFDLVVLGMGADGHTASWFPRAEGLAEALDPPDDATVAAIRAAGSPVAGAYVERMTLTRPAVAEARRVVLLLTGADKRAAFERAVAAGPEADAPVRALLQRPDASVKAYWAP